MRTVVTIAALGVILTLVHFASDVVTPFLIGAVLAVAFQPMSSRWIAVGSRRSWRR